MDKPTITYDGAGQVVSEPDIEARVRAETEEELTKDAAPKGVGFLSGHTRRAMRASYYEEDCYLGCGDGEDIGRTVFDEVGEDDDQYDCSQRDYHSRMLYRIDRRLRGLPGEPPRG